MEKKAPWGILEVPQSPQLIRTLTLQQTYFLSPLQDGRHPNCNFLLEVERDRAECVRTLREEEEAVSSLNGQLKPAGKLCGALYPLQSLVPQQTAALITRVAQTNRWPIIIYISFSQQVFF